MQQSFIFPFTLQEWAYKEIEEAINTCEIKYKEDQKGYILSCYSKEVYISKKQYNETEYDYYA